MENSRLNTCPHNISELLYGRRQPAPRVDHLSLNKLHPNRACERKTRSWHKTACLAVCNALERAIKLDSKEHPEIVAEELRLACNALGRLTGQVAVDDLLDNIFSSFCIGK